MINKLKTTLKKLSDTPFAIVLSIISRVVVFFQLHFLKLKWNLTGKRKPNKEQIQDVCENVTFIYKSFERQKLAKRLYKNIQSYYPGVKVIIADDSAKALELKGEQIEIVQLPFNSGLSAGLNKALELVKTPYVIRMDDDELLTPYTGFHEQLQFLIANPEVDLVGIMPFDLPRCKNLKKMADVYYKQSMRNAPKILKIPHLTKIDETHTVVGKVPNVYIARTEKVREVGYDDNIRMIDHNEFFYRAAGNIVSVLAHTSFVIHYHNHFDRYYNKYRSDYAGDLKYIRAKMVLLKEQSQKSSDEAQGM